MYYQVQNPPYQQYQQQYNQQYGNPGPGVIQQQPQSNQMQSQAQQQQQQPGQVQSGMSNQYMAAQNVPPGLEYLAMLDSIFIRQDLELMEILIGFETKNRYNIIGPRGEFLFKALEESSCCDRYCLGQKRPFEMHIINPANGQPLIHLERPYKCGNCCFPCCGLQEISVFAPPGMLAGSVKQKWSMCPKYDIKDANGDTVLKIKGPCCTTSYSCGNVDFQVLGTDGITEVGRISKQWSGYIQEAYTNADNFGISFPMDLTVQMKAVLIGACFLIDYNYYEGRHRRHHY